MTFLEEVQDPDLYLRAARDPVMWIIMAIVLILFVIPIVD